MIRFHDSDVLTAFESWKGMKNIMQNIMKSIWRTLWRINVLHKFNENLLALENNKQLCWLNNNMGLNPGQPGCRTYHPVYRIYAKIGFNFENSTGCFKFNIYLLDCSLSTQKVFLYEWYQLCFQTIKFWNLLKSTCLTCLNEISSLGVDIIYHVVFTIVLTLVLVFFLYNIDR